MTTFHKQAIGRDARALLDAAKAVERRADGGPFRLAIVKADGAMRLAVLGADARPIGSAELLHLDGIRATALQIIADHRARLAEQLGNGGAA